MVKSYRPAKVTNPLSNGYTTRLRPNQGFNLILSKIDSQHKVLLQSEHLIVLEVKYDYERDQVIYHIQQKHDLSRWERVSNFFIGNVIVYSDKLRTVQVCVLLDCQNKHKQNTVTVTNPSNHLLRIEPNQLVEVVLYSKENHLWQLELNDEIFEQIRHETVINDTQDVYPADDFFCPEVRCVDDLSTNPRLPKACLEDLPANEQCDSRIVEHHFWFRLRRDYYCSMGLLKNGSYNLGSMVFTAGNGEVRTLNIFASLRGAIRERTNFHTFDAITYRAENWASRLKVRNFLFMPNVMEHVEITEGRDYFFIEIPCPQVYSKELTGLWKLDPTYRNELTTADLGMRRINGQDVQRFYVANLTDPKNITADEANKDMPFIASLRFICQKATSLMCDISRNLNIHFWWKDKQLSATRKVEVPPLTVKHKQEVSSAWAAAAYHQSHSCAANTSCSPPVNKNVAKYRDDEVAEIEFFYSKSTDLTLNCRRTVVSKVGSLTKASQNNSAWGGDYDEEAAMSAWTKTSKKKQKKHSMLQE